MRSYFARVRLFLGVSRSPKRTSILNVAAFDIKPDFPALRRTQHRLACPGHFLAGYPSANRPAASAAPVAQRAMGAATRLPQTLQMHFDEIAPAHATIP